MPHPDKIKEIFVKLDDFCKEFDLEIKKYQFDASNCKVRDRKASLANSEIITIMIASNNKSKHLFLDFITKNIGLNIH